MEGMDHFCPWNGWMNGMRNLNFFFEFLVYVCCFRMVLANAFHSMYATVLLINTIQPTQAICAMWLL